MQAKLYNLKREEIASIEIPDRIFAQKWNADLVHQALRVQEFNARVNRAHTKMRGEVSGGGRKPWRQKGTGRARAGSTRSPLWKGGGVTFGPRKDKVFLRRINKKMRKLAISSVLSQKLREGEVLFIPDNEPQVTKTKELLTLMKMFFKTPKRIPGFERTMIITPQKDRRLERASRNLKNISVFSSTSLNARDLLAPRWILIQRSSIPVISKTYSVSKQTPLLDRRAFK